MRVRHFVTILLILGYSQANSHEDGGLLAKVSGAAKGMVDNLFHRVDVNHLYKAVVDDIKRKIGSSSCIAGLYIDINHSDKTLKLIQGKMSDLNHMSTSGRSVSVNGDVATATMTFTFHKIPIKYKFDYTTHRVFIKMERHGHVDLQQEGAVNVEFTVELPKTQPAVENLIKQGKCVASIKSVKTTLKSKLVTKKVDYKTLGTMIGLRITEGSVKKMLAGLREDLEDNIKAAAQLLIEPVFRGHAFNCKDATYTAPVGARAKRATDCNYFNSARKYKRHPETPKG